MRLFLGVTGSNEAHLTQAFAALRLRTGDVIVRMSKERSKFRGLLSGPPGEPEPENQRNQNRTRNTKRGQAVQSCEGRGSPKFLRRKVLLLIPRHSG